MHRPLHASTGERAAGGEGEKQSTGRGRKGRGRAAAADGGTPLQEVNFLLWTLRIWPELKKKAPKELQDQSAAVFTEIFSFIRGSAAAMGPGDKGIQEAGRTQRAKRRGTSQHGEGRTPGEVAAGAKPQPLQLWCAGTAQLTPEACAPSKPVPEGNV